MAASASGVFVGVAVSDVAGLTHLGHVETEVLGLRDLIAAGFDGDPLLNPSTDAVRSRLRTVKKAGLDGSAAVVALWSGHGVPSVNGGLRLLAADSDADESDGLSPADFVSPLALSGASQLLLIVDTCYSGAALDASRVAQSVLSARPPDADHVWIGVLASSSEATTARDGVFAPVLGRLLRDGPKDQTLRLRWSVHNERVRGDDLADAVLKEWDSTEGQQPQFLSFGSAWPIFANPLWRPDAPAQVVEHLLRAARGGDAGERSWFTGRTSEVDEVVGWVRDPAPGVRVVTGLSGTGKSAIVGRVVSMSVGAERELLMGQDPNLFESHSDPGMQSVAAHAHARALTPNRLAQVLDEGLVSSGVLDRADAPRNAGELAGALERKASTVGNAWTPPVVVVDGLDESRAEAFPIAGDVLNRIAEWASVVVATRNLPAPDEQQADLLTTLAPVTTMDISAGEMVDSGREAMRAYVVKRLTGVAPAMDPEAVAEYFSAKVDAAHDDPFLLARLMTSQLRAHPVDTGESSWESTVAMSVGNALLTDLTEVRAPHHRADRTAADLAQGLLAALTWGFGAGLPEDEWLEIAAATSFSGLEPPVGRNDVSWLLEQLGRYVVQDGENGEAVYRLAHQTLTEELRRRLVQVDTDVDDLRLAVALALGRRYRRLLASGLPATSAGYLWRYYWQHAADGGPDSVGELVELARLDSRLFGDVGLALLRLSESSALANRTLDAVAAAEVAVDVYRGLATGPDRRAPELAAALTLLGVRYAEAGRHLEAVPPTQEAVLLRRDLVARHPEHRAALAGALLNLGNRYAEVGRLEDAVAPTEESVEIHRDLASRTPAPAVELSGALNNLSVRLAEVGRTTEALELAEEVVRLRREQVAANPGYAPALASALTNLGTRYAEVERKTDALVPAEEAVALRREQAEHDVAYAPGLALALTNLGIRYGEVGRVADAARCTEEAVRVYEDVASPTHASLRDLAGALLNLGVWYGELGLQAEGVDPTQRAVGIFRDRVSRNPGETPDLAAALDNLGTRYSAVGRIDDAVAAAEEAVDLYRSLTGTVHLAERAMSTANLGMRYGEAGRHAESVAVSEEAVELFRRMVSRSPHHAPGLAGALDNLGCQYADADRPQDAVPPAEEAVRLRREQAAATPGYAPALAGSLANLAARYTQVDRAAEAVPIAEEALRLRREQEVDNAGRGINVAHVLNNLGLCYAAVDRVDDAIAATSEAVERYRSWFAGNRAYGQGLAVALANLSNLIAYSGDPEAALPLVEEAVAVFADLSQQHSAYAPQLATALSQLSVRYDEIGRPPADMELVWDRVVGSAADEVAGYLLGFRAARPDADLEQAGRWLRAALERSALSDVLVGQLHQLARELGDRAPSAIDTVWGSTPPAWLHVTPDHLEPARQWVVTTTMADERDVLLTHPELLGADHDLAVEEVLLLLQPEEQQRLRDLRSSAKQAGAEAAYRLLVQSELAQAFVDGEPEEQAALLTRRRAELLDPELRVHLSTARGAPRALALLDVANGPFSDRALEALERPEAMRGLLDDAAVSPCDPASLEALARLARTADDPGQQARGALFQALARHLADDPDGRDAALADVRAIAPDGLPTWAAELGALAARQPAAAALIEPLLHQPNRGTDG